jgi:hypothetical protein
MLDYIRVHSSLDPATIYMQLLLQNKDNRKVVEHLTQKQVYYYWTTVVGEKFQNKDEFSSAKDLVFWIAPQYTFSGSKKCTCVASPMPFQAFGFTFGLSGTTRMNSNTGPSPTIYWFPSLVPRCSWRRIGERLSAIFSPRTTNRYVPSS